MTTEKNIEILNFKEACDFLKFKKSRLYYEVFRKNIPHFKIGASLRFSKADLEAWIQSKKGGTNE